MQMPLVFLLVKFTDDPHEPISHEEAEILFTDVGRGRRYIVDYFDEITHGHVDMSTNQVFGWIDLGISHAEHDARRAVNRGYLIGFAESVARARGIPVDQFVATVVVTASAAGADFYGGFWNGRGYAQTTADQGVGNIGWESKVSPAALCQELVHALGVPQHTRRQGSDQDYMDPFDVMSLWTSGRPGQHPDNPNYAIGPGINAAFLDRCGWLNTGRGVTITMSGTYSLRPLHRRDLPGNLFAKLGDTYIEYRPKAGWDVGFDESVVLTHYREQQTSYLSEVFTGREPRPEPSPFQIFGGGARIWVSSIDDAAEEATVEVHVPQPAPVSGPVVLLGPGVANDGGGLVMIGGRIVRIPPRSPLLAILEHVVGLQQVEDASIPANMQLQVSQQLFASLAQGITAQLADSQISRRNFDTGAKEQQ